MTLSHCWGLHVPYRLLSENYAELVNGLSTLELSQTFRDAIEITRKFGKQYLWIDSLCIIQNDAEDWQIESSKMRQTYKNSWLNIAAASAKDATEGLFSVRDPRHNVPCSFPSDGTGHVLRMYYNVDSDESLPLHERAWVFQEWLLAPRILQYSAQEVAWECCGLRASEMFPSGYGDAYEDNSNIEEPAEWSAQLAKARSAWRDLPALGSLQRWKLWNMVIHKYTGRALTKASDRLVALAGLAAEMDAGWPNTSYLAGLWSYKLRSGLLWSCERVLLQAPPRMCQNPSWSWARIDHYVLTDRRKILRTDGLAEIIDASVVLASPTDLFKDVLGGCIKIRASLLKTKIRPPKYRNDDYRSTYLFCEQRSSSGSSSATVPSKRDGFEHRHDTVEIRWDELDTLKRHLKETYVYLLPLETALSQTSYSDNFELRGLVVEPTGPKKGQIRRLGWFSIYEQWQDHSNYHPVSSPQGCYVPKANTAMAKRGREGKIVEGDQDYSGDQAGEFDDYNETDGIYVYELPSPVASNDIWATRADHKAWLDKDGRARRNTEELTKRMTALAESLDYHEDLDKYANGPVHDALVQRYGPSTNGLYPRIDSFLTTIYNKYAGPNGDTRELSDLFEEDHGNGYFTSELV